MRNVMLHCNNVCWLGGTMLATHDMIRAWPDFHHVVLYFKDGGEDYDVISRLEEDGIDVRFAPMLTPFILEQIDPSVIFFNNTPGPSVAGEFPYRWLRKYSVIAIHHNPTHPLFEAELDIFVSEHVKKGYADCMKRIKRSIVVPPCINTAEYKSIPRLQGKALCHIGKLSNDNPGKFPQDLIGILAQVRDAIPANTAFTAVGGKKYYKDIPIPIDMPEIGSKPVRDFYAAFDVLVYKNTPEVTDTWGRVITEAMASGIPVVADNRGGPAEQIDHDVNGYLCDTNEDFVKYLKLLVTDVRRRDAMGKAARAKACKEYDIVRLRKATTDAVLAGLRGAA